MSIGQFMPLFSKTAGFTKDPYSEYVIMDLNMDNNGDGVTLVDRSLHGNTFSRFGDAKLETFNRKFTKYSARFDGTGDYYYAPNKALFNMPADFTAEFWTMPVWVRPFPELAAMISHGGNWDRSEPSVGIWSDGKLVLYANGVKISSPAPAPLNTWFHVSYGRKAGRNYLYLDGVLCGTYNYSNSLTNWSCTFGATGWNRTTTANDKHRGNIEGFRWWKGVSVRDGVNNFTPPKAPWAPIAPKAAGYREPTSGELFTPLGFEVFNVSRGGTQPSTLVLMWDSTQTTTSVVANISTFPSFSIGGWRYYVGAHQGNQQMDAQQPPTIRVRHAVYRIKE